MPKAKSKRRAKAAGSGSNKRTKTEGAKAGQSLANATLVGIVVTPSFAAWSDQSFFLGEGSLNHFQLCRLQSP